MLSADLVDRRGRDQRPVSAVNDLDDRLLDSDLRDGGAQILGGEVPGGVGDGEPGPAGELDAVVQAADRESDEADRDELRAGRTVRTAADRAFSASFRTNLTGNTVSFLAAVVLYVLAVGPVRGFAFTLGLSTLIDTILLATFTKSLFGLIARSPRLAQSKVMGLRSGVFAADTQVAEATGGGRRR